MSTNLYWKPVSLSSKTFDTALKWALEEKFGHPVRVKLDRQALGFLDGLRIGKIKDADKLIEAIEKYGTVELWTE